MKFVAELATKVDGRAPGKRSCSLGRVVRWLCRDPGSNGAVPRVVDRRPLARPLQEHLTGSPTLGLTSPADSDAISCSLVSPLTSAFCEIVQTMGSMMFTENTSKVLLYLNGRLIFAM